MLRFILADAELELVPEAVAGHPQVRAHAKLQGRRPGELLLDQNQHRQACKLLPEGERRGRPDITHYTLLALLESPLCKDGDVEVAVHCRGGTLLRIRNDTRLPRGEQRFQGLIAKVLREGASQDADPLLWSEGRKTPAEVVAEFGKGTVLRLDEGGEALAPRDLMTRADGGDLTLVLGGFPHGDFGEGWKTAAPTAVSIYKDPLNAWAVASECVAGCRI